MAHEEPNILQPDGFQDFLPIMAEKLGSQGFMTELCNGFNLLADPAVGAITFDSLKTNAACLGLEKMSDDELRAMIREGDVDGDGVLKLQEFCTLMVRMSPSMMAEAEEWLGHALAQESPDFTNSDASVVNPQGMKTDEERRN